MRHLTQVKDYRRSSVILEPYNGNIDQPLSLGEHI
ncbi:hypothetical protein HNQ81_002554 [Desulfoprunum benzoelyticum]|uniref:Uncharacterized protein n=1 Tax=Desulfoprunum benzoelyticum TaxID=1506996 RepID=A0A840UZD3_9BACT|nr:hypothetical protein [Desulfoprunum benzoelyticum]